MKFGDLEGTPTEIKDFFENSGLRVSDYFQPPEKPIHSCWLFVPAIILLGSVLWPNLVQTKTQQMLPFLVGSLGDVWLAIALQIRFKQIAVTGIAVTGCAAVLAVSYGLLTPVEAIKALQTLHNDA